MSAARFVFLSLALHGASLGSVALIWHHMAPFGKVPMKSPTEIAVISLAHLRVRQEAEPRPSVQVPSRDPLSSRAKTAARGTGWSSAPLESAQKPSTPPPFRNNQFDAARQIDLFSASAIERAAGEDLVSERKSLETRVARMTDDMIGLERTASGNVHPRWREIERALTESFRPQLDLVKEASLVASYGKQMLRNKYHLSDQIGQLDLSSDFIASKVAVEIEVIVGEEGEILKATITLGSGRRRFDRAALEAVVKALSDRGPLRERGPITTRWLVEASLQIMPPTANGFRFDETGHLDPNASGIRRFIAPVHALQQRVLTRIALLSAYPQGKSKPTEPASPKGVNSDDGWKPN